ncbi:cytochrome P450 [Setomelanomma holmii]|uniref:Cytochrome P450 n=1 Tax=Setomelanomma holmii TaxID=210430 RepID=A0A9P4LTR8_9PLEO|nr:cytochrome P450 [Setomelanomma holmii]
MAYFHCTSYLLGPLAAVTLHELILRRAEVDHLALSIIVTSIVAYFTIFLYAGFLPATTLSASFWLPLWSYIGIYRAYLHPLRKYPGPFGARLSKWWTVKQNWDTDLHFHRRLQDLQTEYGDYVRTGPRELTIFDVDAIPAILGGQSKTSKGPLFDIMDKSLHLNRDKQFHRQRRRIWDNAFKASLSDYAPKIEEFTQQSLTRLRKQEGNPVPLLEYMTYYSYDVMAALAFGKPMGFIKGEQSDVGASILKTMTGSLYAFGLLHHMPWLMNTLGVLTSLAGPMKEWTDWSVSRMKARIAVKDAKPDLISHLIANTPDTSAGHTLLYGESRLIISAGSETTSSALTFIFMHLATHPEYLHALRKEFRAHASTYHCQSPLPLLDAIVFESMRLWPSVFFASQRVTPPEGLRLKNHFVPGNMIVQVSPFVLSRDPRNFVEPNDFIPERWLDRSELVLRKEAFIPFSTGPYSCAGKGLAMMELRSVVGRVVSEFDVVLPVGFEPEAFWEGIRDHFTAGAPRVDVRFVKWRGGDTSLERKPE